MKSFLHLLTFGLVATAASAAPLVEKDGQQTIYALSISTNGNTALDGSSLEIFNNILGVFPGAQTAAQVYPIANPANPRLKSLHTFPIGIVDHVLGLRGDNGLYDLVDVLDVGQNADGLYTDNFVLKNGKVTQNLDGGWVAFPSASGWSIKWYDRSAIVTQNYVPVEILYKRINTY